MKKIFILGAIIITLSNLSVIGQDFKAGILGGTVFSQVDGDYYTGFFKPGLVGGLYVSRPINNDWLAQFEIVYKQKGSLYNGNESIGDYSQYKMALEYMEVPILIKLFLNSVALEGGFTFGKLLSYTEEDEFGDLDATIEFEDFEWGSLVGVNYQIHDQMHINIRWCYSISRIRKAYGGEYDDAVLLHWSDKKMGQYNHSVSFSLYYELDKLFTNR